MKYRLEPPTDTVNVSNSKSSISYIFILINLKEKQSLDCQVCERTVEKFTQNITIHYTDWTCFTAVSRVENKVQEGQTAILKIIVESILNSTVSMMVQATGQIIPCVHSNIRKEGFKNI